MSYYALPDRAFLRLHGPDSARYLNGQITQKVAAVDQASTLWTAITDAKGRIEGVGCLQQLPDGSYLIDCPAELGDAMEARLDRYLIADDCEWSREDERWQILCADSLSACEGEEEYAGGHRTVSARFRAPRAEVLVDRSVAEGAQAAPALPGEVADAWCAANAVPRWGREITGGELPAEVGLYELALSFDKGCYIGQEIISRMETAGKTRTRLYQLQSETPLDASLFTTTATIEAQHYGLAVCKQAPEGGKVY